MYYNMHHKIWKAAEQKVLPQDMDAQFIESILFDRTLYKYEILGRMASTVRITKQHVLSLSLWMFGSFTTSFFFLWNC
jgi:argininosuccinate lyase